MTDPVQRQPAPDLPHWPRCGASAIVFRGAEVLLVERAKGALKGRWSLPGGHVEPGERVAAAAKREVREEAAIGADIGGLVDVHEVLLKDGDGALAAHYIIAVFWGRWLEGEPVAGDDAAEACFVPIGDVEEYPLTEGAAALIRRAWTLYQSA